MVSWEVVTILSVIVICITHILVNSNKNDPRLDSFATKDQTLALEAWLASIEKSVAILEQNGEAIQKTHDETKKLLSQANLAGAIRGVR